MSIRDCFEIAENYPFEMDLEGMCDTYAHTVMVVDTGIGSIPSYPDECENLTPTIYDARFALLDLKAKLGDALTYEKWLEVEHAEACAPLADDLITLIQENGPRIDETIEMQKEVLEDLFPFKNLPGEEIFDITDPDFQ